MTSPRWPTWANAAGLLILSFITLASFSLQAGPGAGVMAVSFPLWWSAERTLAATAAADVAIVRLTAIPTIVVVQIGDPEGIARLKQAGAWLMISSVAIAACLTTDLGN